MQKQEISKQISRLPDAPVIISIGLAFWIGVDCQPFLQQCYFSPKGIDAWMIFFNDFYNKNAAIALNICKCNQSLCDKLSYTLMLFYLKQIP